MKMRAKWAAAAAAGVALTGLGVSASQVALADPTPSSPPSSAAPTAAPSGAPSGTPGQGKGHAGPRAERQAHLTQLAKALGVDEAKLRTAVQEVRTARQADRPAPGQRLTKDQRQARRDAYVKALAEKLGVSESKVSDALKQVRTDERAQAKQALSKRLDRAVKNGKLTRAEADAVLKAADLGIVHGR